LKVRALPHVEDPIRALRQALKVLLRRFGLKCVPVNEERTEDDPRWPPANYVAGALGTTNTHRMTNTKGATTMTDEAPKPPKLELVAASKDPAAIFDDLEALRKASKLTIKRKGVLVNVPVSKPTNNVYFRTHPDLDRMVLERETIVKGDGTDGSRKAIYYITAEMRNHPRLV
jgi:hypothetical protein